MARRGGMGIIVGFIFVTLIVIILSTITVRKLPVWKNLPIVEFKCKATKITASQYEAQMVNAIDNDDWSEATRLYGQYEDCFPERKLSVGLRADASAKIDKCTVKGCKELKEAVA